MQIDCKSNQNTNNILYINRKILNFTWNEEEKKIPKTILSKRKEKKREKNARRFVILDFETKLEQ